VKGVRSFLGMVNYFRDVIKELSSHLIPLTRLTKKNATQKGLNDSGGKMRCLRQGCFG
jgi:hypothetical protein